jgi:hypothetical protein
MNLFWVVGFALASIIAGTGLMAKILQKLIAIYFVIRATSVPVSRWLDRKFKISGSIQPISDSLYLGLQIPVMLIYCSYLSGQTS